MAPPRPGDRAVTSSVLQTLYVQYEHPAIPHLLHYRALIQAHRALRDLNLKEAS